MAIIKEMPLGLDPSSNGQVAQEFAEVPVGSLVREIATRAAAGDIQGFASWLPNPDPILRKTGQDIETYQELLSDAKVSGVLDGREAAVLKLKWRLKKEGVKARSAELTEKMLKRLNIRKISSEGLDANAFGHQFMEVMWEPFFEPRSTQMLIAPRDILGKPHRYFQFDSVNQPRFLSRDSGTLEGVPLPPRKFLVPTNKGTYDNPYGEAVLSKCYWPVVFKRGGLRFWATFVERYGMPWIKYEYPVSWAGDVEKIRKQVATLEKMVQDAIIAVPQGSAVSFESGGEGSSSEQYNRLMDWCDTQIAYAILGHTGSCASTPGKLGGEDAAMDVREDYTDADKAMIEGMFNELIRWVYEINFGEEVIPTFELYAEDDIQMPLVNRSKVLWDMGVRFTEDYFINNLGLKKGEFTITDEAPAATGVLGGGIDLTPKEPGAQGSQAGAGATGGQSAATGTEETKPMAESGTAGKTAATGTNGAATGTGATSGGGAAQFAEDPKSNGKDAGVSIPDEMPGEEFLKAIGAKLTPELMQSQMEKILEPIFGMIDGAKSYDQVISSLKDVFPRMDTSELQAMVERVTFTAELIGRNTVVEETAPEDAGEDIAESASPDSGSNTSE